MAQIEQVASGSKTTTTTTTTSTPPEQESLLTLWDETLPAQDGTTMVEWLSSTFHQHKKRLFGAVRASHQSQLFLNKMKERHDAGNFPDFIAELSVPKALDGLPNLQALWDEVHSQYKENLYQALVNSREEKLSTQYSPAVRDEIIKSMVADTKKLITDKSTADPAHKDTFEAEGKAAFTLFTNSTTSWEQEAREQALLHFTKQKAQREANESQALNSANTPSTAPAPAYSGYQGNRYQPYPQRGTYQPRGRGRGQGNNRGTFRGNQRGTYRGRGAARGRGT
ncbi:hypothetical protein BJY52DRAFT_1232302 [Lactarius psammicola]|nr:hypothetical protein BJY52DRAFT_1232302 [Lactarius psammicola]